MPSARALLVTLLLLVPSLAMARYSQFRVVEQPEASKKGLEVKLFFDAKWPKNDKAANKGVEFNVYTCAPEPNAVRGRAATDCFAVKDVPAAGALDLLIPLKAIGQVKGKPGGKVFLVGHWRNAAAAGVGATHVHGFRTREVPIALPQDLKLPAAKAAQNSRLGGRASLHRRPWRPAWRPARAARWR